MVDDLSVCILWVYYVAGCGMTVLDFFLYIYLDVMVFHILLVVLAKEARDNILGPESTCSLCPPLFRLCYILCR